MQVQIGFYPDTDFSLKYKTSKDVFKLSDKEVTDLLNSYLGKKVKYTYCSYYGGEDEVEVWVSDFQKMSNKYIVTISTSIPIPERFIPGLSDLGEELGLVFPISTHLIY